MVRVPLNKKKAFTLVEILLYIGIAATVILAVSISITLLLQSRVKNQTIAEVEQQGIQIMQTVTQTIRNAEAVNSPSQGSSGPSLSLDVTDAAKDPTTFDISGGSINITEGADPSVSLNNIRLIPSDLTFRNLSRDNTPGIIRVEFTLTHVNPEGRNELDCSKVFRGSASLR